MTISVSMIVKNESSCLAKCLETVKDADEIVIVDTGSTDNTVDIARQYTENVFTGQEYLWRDDFAFSRNQSLELCSGDWVLIIDADETLESGGIEKLRKAIAKTSADALFFKTVSAGSGTVVHNSIRAFRNGKNISWKGRVHNYLSINKGDIVDIQITYGYSDAHKADPDRALRILKDVVNTEPNCKRERYYLAREYWYRGDYITASYWWNNYLSIATWGPEMADAWLMLSRCYWKLKKSDQARDACLQAIKINANFQEACLFMAEMSGPKNRQRWNEIAATANNEDVLFVRKQQEESEADYYDQLWSSNPDMSRYKKIYRRISQIVTNETLLDVGCGNATLESFIKNYYGFDIAEKTIEKLKQKNINVWVGDAMEKSSYRQKTSFCSLVEVLEHVQDDMAVINTLPYDTSIIITVPSFGDKKHVRVFNEKIFRERYKDKLEILDVEYFALVKGCWDTAIIETHPGILLAICRRKEEVST